MPESRFEKIERYLENRMSPDEKSEFESELMVNGELADDFEMYKMDDFEMYKMIEEEMHDFENDRRGEEALKDSLKEISASLISRGQEELPHAEKEKDYSPLRALQPSSGRLGRIRVLQQFAVAAAIIGIIALGITWYFINSKESSIAINKKPTDVQNTKQDSVNSRENKPQENLASDENKNKQKQELNNTKEETLYASNFKRDKTPEIKDEFLEDAYSYYDNGEYKRAIKAFDNTDFTIVSRGDETDTILRKFYAHYYKAQSYMAINNFRSAIVELKDAINQNIDSLKINAQWYLALAYLKNGDLKKTDSLLTIVAANKIKTEYKRKAQTLLNNLEKDK